MNIMINTTWSLYIFLNINVPILKFLDIIKYLEASNKVCLLFAFFIFLVKATNLFKYDQNLSVPKIINNKY